MGVGGPRCKGLPGRAPSSKKFNFFTCPAVAAASAPSAHLHHRVKDLPMVQLDLKLAQLQVLCGVMGAGMLSKLVWHG